MKQEHSKCLKDKLNQNLKGPFSLPLAALKVLKDKASCLQVCTYNSTVHYDVKYRTHGIFYAAFNLMLLITIKLNTTTILRVCVHV